MSSGVIKNLKNMFSEKYLIKDEKLEEFFSNLKECLKSEIFLTT